ncbi:MAG: hypothetical protein GXO71_06480 [Caldiserica bacterium]|nr:hypothetical protein [Caldisericota bacterium]
MLASLLITLREGIEAALIVGIIITYLSKINKSAYIKEVVLGIVIAVFASAGTAWLFEKIMGGFSGHSENIFEGVIMLLAVSVLTYMIIWMHHQAKNIAGNLKEQINAYISHRQIYGLAFLGFISVYREGVETVLFFAALRAADAASWIGGILGLLIAVILAILFFKTTRHFSLKRFFQVTGLFIILIAAGLFSHGIHELQEARIIPTVKEHLFDINPTITYGKTEKMGSLLSRPDWQKKIPGENQEEVFAFIQSLTRNDTYQSKKYKPYQPLIQEGWVEVKTPFRLAFHENGTVGSFLKALFGYNANPSLIELLAYLFYYFAIYVLVRLSRHRLDQ